MFPDKSSKSSILFERAKTVFPGGNTRHTNFFPPYPVYAASGKGCRVTDADGKSYVDFMNNASALIHGHSHPEIVAAMTDQIQKLTSVGRSSVLAALHDEGFRAVGLQAPPSRLRGLEKLQLVSHRWHGL